MPDELQTIPDERPKRTPPRVNVRKAMAGIRLARGEGSLAACLVASGFSRATSRSQLRNGLTAEQCLAEAEKLGADTSPAKLLETGRRTLLETVAMAEPGSISVRDATRLLDVTEKYFGGHVSPLAPQAVSVAERMGTVLALAVIIQERSQPVVAKDESQQAKGPTIIDVEATKRAE